jgi:GT2 family glycosyltransferase
MSPFYWEDVELSYRAWKRGWVIHYEPKSVVYLDATSDPRELTRGLRLDRMNTRNRFIFLWKNLHDPGMWLVHLVAVPVLCLQALVTLRAAFFLGLWDSIRKLPTILSKRRLERRAAKVPDGAIRRLFNELRKKNFVVLR